MNYLSLPPEVTSTMIYSGPGSEPMVVASSAWSALAAELKTIAAEYRSVINLLTSEEWLGPASAAMATAAAPYVNWMELTAAQAEQTAAQGRSAAAAYEAAHAQTVPPVAVTANRQLLQQLVATNILGQNTPSIAATEAEHGEMWAQDTMAMYGYQAQSSAATELSEFTSPPNPTNPGSEAGPATNANQAAPASSALQNLFRPMSAESTGSPAGDILDDPNYQLGGQAVDMATGQISMYSNNLCAVWRGMSGLTGLQKMFADGAKDAAKAASGAADAAKGAASGAAGAASAASGAASGAARAAAGAAGSLGGLSVPPSWTVPSAPLTALGPVSGGTWQPIGGAAAGGILGGSPMAPPMGMAGMPAGAAGAAGAGFKGFGGPRYGSQLTVMPRRPFGG
ncbi:PPE family protein [Mycobacterium sp. UM_Kg27]|uniref:PPE family protein n=1 Tax=Mycobacterium sp. UM_Kg27 TaxID=1545693 RepID=UPI00061B31DE|nr:PPE family protein [Mycobacterium sp. UM_Kg27]